MKINNNKVFAKEHKFDVFCNIYTSYLIKEKKGSRTFYDIFAGVKEMNSHEKWLTDVGVIRDTEWQLYNTTIRKNKEVKLQDFQYKINNKILVTNSFLCKIGKIDSNLCSFCKEHPEKINHLFLECDKVKEFWNSLKLWFNINANIVINLDKRNIIFSYQGQNELINYIHVLAKYYIYKTKFSKNNLNIQAFVSMLQQKFLSERYIAFINNKTDIFFKKWTPLYNYFIPQNNP